MEFGEHYPQKKQNSERNPDIQKQIILYLGNVRN